MTRQQKTATAFQKNDRIRKDVPLTLMASPGILFLFIFNYLPMFGLILAFKNFRYDKGIFGSAWVGLDNFLFFFRAQDAWRVTRNTIGYNTVFIFSTLVISVALALLLFEIVRVRAIKFYQTSLFIPYLLSMSVVAYISYAFLSADYGVLNSLLEKLGQEPRLWYQEAVLWIFVLPVIYIWKNAGYYIIIYYAGLMGIDKTYYEAAQIDGAGKLKVIFKITLPLLAPILIMMVLLQIGQIFYSDFGLFYLVTKDTGSLYRTTDVIDTYIYRLLRVTGDIGIAGAVGFYQSVVGFLLVLTSNLIVRKIDRESALF